jgi:Flp pilus assembly protein TadD
MTRLPVLLALALLVTACAGGKEALSGEGPGDDVRARRGKEADPQVVQITYIEGVRARQLGDPGLAERRFNEVLELDPDNAAARYELARLRFEDGDVADALPLAVRAAELEPDNPYYVELQADLLTVTGQFDAAAAACRRLAELRPDDLEPWFRLAYNRQQSGDLDGALEAYGQVQERFGAQPSLLLEKHRIHLMRGDLEAATAELEELVRLFPDDPQHFELLARAYESNNRPDLAAGLYERLLGMEGENPALLLRAATIYGRKGDHATYRAKAVEAFSSPEVDIDAKVAFLVPWIDSLGTDFATRDFVFDLNERLVRTHPDDPKSHALRGDFLYHDGEKAAARDSYLRSLEAEKGIFDVWRQVFQIDLETGNEDSLAAITARAMDYFPNQPSVFYFNGYANLRTERAETAVSSLRRALPMSIGNDAFRADIQSLLGDALHELGRHDESDEAYRASLAINPENAFVLNNFAYYLSLRGEHLEEAGDMASRAVELDPENPSFLDTYAWVLYGLGEYRKAREWQEKALAAGGASSPVQQEHYGDILFRLGQVDAAVDAWNKARELGGDSPALDRKIAERRLP